MGNFKKRGLLFLIRAIEKIVKIDRKEAIVLEEVMNKGMEVNPEIIQKVL